MMRKDPFTIGMTVQDLLSGKIGTIVWIACNKVTVVDAFTKITYEFEPQTLVVPTPPPYQYAGGEF